MFDIDSYIESYTKSEKDIEYDLNSWKNGSKNILLITGLSGSGKSTKAAKLAKEYNAVNFELDLFEHNNILFNSNLKHDEANLIMKDIFEKTYGGKKDFNKCNDDQFKKEFVKFFKKLLAYCESNKDKKFIIEGLQIFKHIASTDVGIIENIPIIINGTSLVTSIVRRFKRDYNCSDGSFKHPIKLIKKYLEWEESLNNLRNKDYLKKPIKESTNDNERKSILDRAEKAVLSVFNKFAVDKKSKEDFINGNKGEWNANTICLGGYPKDKYNKIFKALKDEFKGDNNVRIQKDNYFTIFLKINRNSKLFIKENTLLEAYKEHINPVYIITSYTGTIFGKLIKKATDSVYTHSAISFEPTLTRMYSYGNSGNMSDSKLGGMTCESLKDYIKTNKDAKILVSVIFLKDRDYRKLETYFDNYINNVKNTTYDYSNLINILKNKALPNDHSLSSVCSQFVDSLFKWVGADITDKPSNLVTPQDIADIRHPRVYKLYEGLAIKYNSVYVSILVDKLQKYNGMPIKETCKDLTTARKFVSDVNKLAKKYDANYFIVTDGASGINNTGNPAVSNARDAHKKWEKSHKFDPDEDWSESIKEAKEFPVQFNNEGDLLIKKKEKIDFQSECNKSKKLRPNYVKYNNLEGLKYECCKLWYMNVILLKLLDNKNLSDSDREDLNLYRSKVLTEFPLYLKEIQKIDKNFNFSYYYENTPFSNTKVKIKGSTIKYSLDLLRKIFI